MKHMRRLVKVTEIVRMIGTTETQKMAEHRKYEIVQQNVLRQ